MKTSKMPLIMEAEEIRIAIIDDHTIVRYGMRALMREIKELKIVFDAGNGLLMQKALARYEQPHVILMDIEMPDMDGYEATRWLRKNYPHIKVLALTSFLHDSAVIKMLKCGAHGYILKASTPGEVFEAIKAIYNKGFYLNEMVSGKLIRSITQEEEAPKLTKRETEFLILCCSEHTYKEIAEIMCVSARTVDNYRESLFEKLGVKSRTGLVLYAIQSRLFVF